MEDSGGGGAVVVVVVDWFDPLAEVEAVLEVEEDVDVDEELFFLLVELVELVVLEEVMLDEASMLRLVALVDFGALVVAVMATGAAPTVVVVVGCLTGTWVVVVVGGGAVVVVLGGGAVVVVGGGAVVVVVVVVVVVGSSPRTFSVVRVEPRRPVRAPVAEPSVGAGGARVGAALAWDPASVPTMARTDIPRALCGMPVMASPTVAATTMPTVSTARRLGCRPVVP